MPRRVWLALRDIPQEKIAEQSVEALNGGLKVLLIMYFALQIFIPFRHWFIPGDVRWTEEGHNFSWRMKLRSKSADFVIRARDLDSGELFHVIPRKYLTPRQIRKMSTRPHMYWQFARFIRDEYRETRGIQNLAVYAIAVASVNGRPFQVFLDPTVDLISASDPFWGAASWIMPLTPGLPIGEYGQDARPAFSEALGKFKEPSLKMAAESSK